MAELILAQPAETTYLVFVYENAGIKQHCRAYRRTALEMHISISKQKNLYFAAEVIAFNLRMDFLRGEFKVTPDTQSLILQVMEVEEYKEKGINGITALIPVNLAT